MAYQLRMSDELHDWLADLASTDPARAVAVAEALTALLVDGVRLGPPTVVPVTAPAAPADPAEYLDVLYQGSLERLQGIRRRVADIAATRKRLEERIARKGENPGLRRQLDEVTEAEERLTVQSQREQTRVDAYRIRKETLKARLTAAQAEASVYTGLAELDLAEGDGGSQDEDLGALAASARERLTEIEQEVQRVTSAVGKAEGRPGQAPAPGLMELRAGTPGDGEVRIVLAIEPPGTVLLIAVLEGSQAWREHYEQAIALSSEVLLSVRDGEAPEAAARQYDGPREFLAEFFPADAGRMGITEDQVADIERAEAGATEVGVLGRYVEALGGRLEIVADFGEDRVLLR